MSAIHAYSVSKVPFDFLMTPYAAEPADVGFAVIAINPGVRS